MKILFWLCIIALIISENYTIRGFVNVYYKNYNGGPSSSSGSIVYTMIIVGALIVAGLVFYFLGYLKIATLIVGLPVAAFIIFMLIRFFPYLLGAKMN